MQILNFSQRISLSWNKTKIKSSKN
jgi:hypothetical protein